MKHTLFIFLLVAKLGSFSQNLNNEIETYFTEIQKAEEYLINDKIDSALFQYEKTFIQFDYPFAKEMYNSLIIACIRKDSSFANDLFQKLSKRGLGATELEFIRSNFGGQSFISGSLSNYETYHRQYINSIDQEKYEAYSEIDITDQIQSQISIKLKKTDDFKIRKFYESRDSYLKNIKKFGFPLEKDLGIGSIMLIGYFLKTPKEPLKSMIYKEINDSILDQNDPRKKYILFTPSKNNFVNYQKSRLGNGFLWHFLGFKDSTTLNMVFSGIQKFGIHPLFAAQAIERSGETEDDCALGMGSKFLSNHNYKFDLKYNSEHPTYIDQNRKKYFIRPISKERELIKKILELYLNKKVKKLKNSLFKKNRILIVSFSNHNVG